MKRLLKLLYILFLVSIWLVVVCLSLELGTRVILSTANYLYKPLFERENAKVYRTVRLTEELKPRSDGEINNKQVSVPVVSPYTGDDHTDIVDPYTCRKDYELTLQGTAEIYFDKQGNIIQSYGDPVIGRYIQSLVEGHPEPYQDPGWETVLDVIRNPSKAPFQAEMKYINTYAFHYHIQILPQPEGLVLTAREIRDGYPLSLIAPPNYPDENSSWRVPFYAYKPNVDRYNNLGFRDDDIVIPKPEGVFRIVCVGGSTTEEGIANDMTYPNVLEQKLKKYFQTEKIDVINAGVIGQRSFGEVRRIDDFLNLQPNMLIYYNAVNDICLVDIPYLLRYHQPYREIIIRSTLLNRIFNRELLPPDDYIAEYFHKTIFRNLGAMNCACKKKGVQMVVCSFAYPTIKGYEIVTRLYYDFNLRNCWLSLTDELITFKTYLKILHIYNRELQKFCEQENIFFIPVAEEFHGGADHFTDICHMTPIGIDIKTNIIGSYIARWIEKNKWKQ